LERKKEKKRREERKGLGYKKEEKLIYKEEKA
jgi:hypothetical protein